MGLRTCTGLATATEDDDTTVQDEDGGIVETKVVTLMMALDTVTVREIVDTETACGGTNVLVPTEDVVVRICQALLLVACDRIGGCTATLGSDEPPDVTEDVVGLGNGSKPPGGKLMVGPRSGGSSRASIR